MKKLILFFLFIFINYANFLSAQNQPLGNDKEAAQGIIAEEKVLEEQIKPHITFYDALKTFKPSINLKLHINVHHGTRAVIKEDGNTRVTGSQFTFPGLRLGIAGSVLPHVDYVLIPKFDNFKPDILLANLKFNFLDKKLFFKVGKYRPFLVRAFTSKGSFFFFSPAPIYITLAPKSSSVKEYFATALGAQLGADLLNNQLHIYLSLWNKDLNNYKIDKAYRHSLGLRVEYDVFEQWNHGRERFNPYTRFNVRLGTGFAFIYNELKPHVTPAQEKDIPLVHGFRATADMSLKAHVLYFKTAFALNYSLGLAWGFHSDMGFHVLKWLMPGLRISYVPQYKHYNTKLSQFDNIGEKLGLGLIVNFYPFGMVDNYQLKIKLGFDYNILEPTINSVNLVGGNQFAFGASIVFDM